ncbi:MAG: hypothetical protein Q9210_002872 [Variospora velana]
MVSRVEVSRIRESYGLPRKGIIPTPENTLFGNDVFRNTCNRLHGKNEARIKKDLLPLIVPSAEPLATLGAEHLNIVAESVDEGWGNCIPVTKPRPQPDYAVGFARSAFSESQLSNLQPFLGDPSDLSFFMATYYMHFPFLTGEVKCGTTGLDIADRQNTHSMTIADRAIVELFRAAGRQQEVHQRICAFSFSHDHESQLQDQTFAQDDGEQIPITPDTSTQTVARKKKQKK